MEIQIPLAVKKVVFLNALVPPQKKMLILASPISWEEAKKIVEAVKGNVPIVSYIGHQSTVDAVRQMLGIEVQYNRGMYTPESNDLAIIVRLKTRLPQTTDVQVKPEDLELIMALYIS